jgi:hypothetical protein
VDAQAIVAVFDDGRVDGAPDRGDRREDGRIDESQLEAVASVVAPG